MYVDTGGLGRWVEGLGINGMGVLWVEEGIGCSVLIKKRLYIHTYKIHSTQPSRSGPP